MEFHISSGEAQRVEVVKASNSLNFVGALSAPAAEQERSTLAHGGTATAKLTVEAPPQQNWNVQAALIHRQTPWYSSQFRSS
jgi:hypothetical protein